MKRRILVQIDGDARPSVFDSVVAIDGGAETLLRYSNVAPENVRELVFGCIFTRGPKDLPSTAIFVGGSDTRHGEALFQAAQKSFLGPLRVSVMFDANGCNTTAAAAVLSAAKHIELSKCRALILGGTGPVGQRAARMLAIAGASIRVASREVDRAEAVCKQLRGKYPHAALESLRVSSAADLPSALEGVQLVIAAGAAGVELLPLAERHAAKSLQVAIDLNAVPPLGIAGVQVHDRARPDAGHVCYGAIGVGGLKMKIHRAAIESLFATNDLVLDAEEIFALGRPLAEG